MLKFPPPQHCPIFLELHERAWRAIDESRAIGQRYALAVKRAQQTLDKARVWPLVIEDVYARDNR
jgi:hypothetical protein